MRLDCISTQSIHKTNLFFLNFLVYTYKVSNIMRSLCLMKCDSETIQKLPCFWNMNFTSNSCKIEFLPCDKRNFYKDYGLYLRSGYNMDSMNDLYY